MSFESRIALREMRSSVDERSSCPQAGQARALRSALASGRRALVGGGGSAAACGQLARRVDRGRGLLRGARARGRPANAYRPPPPGRTPAVRSAFQRRLRPAPSSSRSRSRDPGAAGGHAPRPTAPRHSDRVEAPTRIARAEPADGDGIQHAHASMFPHQLRVRQMSSGPVTHAARARSGPRLSALPGMART